MRTRLSASCSTALVLTALTTTLTGCRAPATAHSEDRKPPGCEPIVETESGRVRGITIASGYAFRGVPYAAPPTGQLRWRPPQPAAEWDGIRDATNFAPSCPQTPPTFTQGPTDEDCLYLNVYTPQLGEGRRLPVLVWIHGGGLNSGAGRDYDPTKLATSGIVVVTINYRLGALGFLSHPALAAQPGGASGNYGLMDQQASLRWVQDNIEEFGGQSDNITIAGESAGGLSVLAHVVSASSRGLFQRAIVQSGSFALTQQPHAAAEAWGQEVAAKAGCSDQTATCMRSLSVTDLVTNFSRPVIPGTIDGAILTESIGTALAAGRFNRVPILNGSNHDEELLFVAGLKLAVSNGTFALVPDPVTADNYQSAIASVMGVTDERAAVIAAEYPVEAYPAPLLALSALVGDANFACTALRQDKWTSRTVQTFAYEFNDDAAPPRYAPIPAATHLSELAYLFDLPDAPLQGALSAEQERLAANMRAAWVQFATKGDPSTATIRWPSFDEAHVMSLVPPRPQITVDFAAKHHCSFWAAP